MAEIIIKNFGPIIASTVEIKQINIFIGPTSTGKSTVAKLIAIFNTLNFIQNPSYDAFLSQLIYYNISFPFTDATYIEYRSKNFYWRFAGKLFATNFFLPATINFLAVVQASIETVGSEPASIGININGKNIRQIRLPLYLVNSIDIEQISREIATIENDVLKEHLIEISQKLILNRNEIAHNGFLDVTGEFENLSELLRSVNEEVGVSTPLYIPAERITMSMVAESIFGILKNDVSLPVCLKDFGAKFEIARRGLKEVSIDFFNAVYYQKENTNIVKLVNGEEIKLEHASSGFQSLIPMYIVLQFFLSRRALIRKSTVIEEPELNLYPKAQKDFVEYLIKLHNNSGDKLFITTHSPYVLTTIDNLIQSNNAVANKPQNEEAVASIIDPALWVNFEDVSCYYFSNGYCKSTLDTENQTIGASDIDDVSIELGKVFDQLLDLKYN